MADPGRRAPRAGAAAAAAPGGQLSPAAARPPGVVLAAMEAALPLGRVAVGGGPSPLGSAAGSEAGTPPLTPTLRRKHAAAGPAGDDPLPSPPTGARAGRAPSPQRPARLASHGGGGKGSGRRSAAAAAGGAVLLLMLLGMAGSHLHLRLSKRVSEVLPAPRISSASFAADGAAASAAAQPEQPLPDPRQGGGAAGGLSALFTSAAEQLGGGVFSAPQQPLPAADGAADGAAEAVPAWLPRCAVVNNLVFHIDVMAGWAYAFQSAGCDVTVYQNEQSLGIEEIMSAWLTGGFRPPELFPGEAGDYHIVILPTFRDQHAELVQYLLQLPRLRRQRYFLTQHNPDWLLNHPNVDILQQQLLAPLLAAASARSGGEAEPAASGGDEDDALLPERRAAAPLRLQLATLAPCVSAYTLRFLQDMAFNLTEGQTYSERVGSFRVRDGPLGDGGDRDLDDSAERRRWVARAVHPDIPWMAPLVPWQPDWAAPPSPAGDAAPDAGGHGDDGNGDAALAGLLLGRRRLLREGKGDSQKDGGKKGGGGDKKAGGGGKKGKGDKKGGDAKTGGGGDKKAGGGGDKKDGVGKKQEQRPPPPPQQQQQQGAKVRKDPAKEEQQQQRRKEERQEGGKKGEQQELEAEGAAAAKAAEAAASASPPPGGPPPPPPPPPSPPLGAEAIALLRQLNLDRGRGAGRAAPRHVCIQGKLENSRRNYTAAFEALRHPAVLHRLRATGEKLLLLGHRSRWEAVEVPGELGDVVVVLASLPYAMFFDTLSRCRAILLAFATDEYYVKKSSSTIATAINVGVPLVAERRTLQAYDFLTQGSCFVYDDEYAPEVPQSSPDDGSGGDSGDGAAEGAGGGARRLLQWDAAAESDGDEDDAAAESNGDGGDAAAEGDGPEEAREEERQRGEEEEEQQQQPSADEEEEQQQPSADGEQEEQQQPSADEEQEEEEEQRRGDAVDQDAPPDPPPRSYSAAILAALRLESSAAAAEAMRELKARVMAHNTAVAAAFMRDTAGQYSQPERDADAAWWQARQADRAAAAAAARRRRERLR